MWPAFHNLPAAMNTQDFLPDNDVDLRLAKNLEEYRLEGKKLSGIQDPIINPLLNYKKSYQQAGEQVNLDSKRIWNTIESDTLDKSAKITPIHKHYEFFRWAVAAAIVIAAFTGIFWFNNLNKPVLLAETQNSAEQISLKDGSFATLRPYSKLYEISYNDTRQVYSLEGEVYFEVNSDANREFIAENEAGRVIVLGTKFLFRDWGNQSAVYLEEGRVRFETKDQQSSVILSPGEFSSISGNSITPPVEQPVGLHKDWLTQTLVLDNQQIRYVIAEIEQHYNIEINGLENATDTLGGSIQLDDLAKTLEDLGIVIGGTFRKTGNSEYTFIELQ